MRRLVFASTILMTASVANAAVTSSTVHGALGNSLNGSVAVGDALSGLIATELPGDNGWHPANPAATNGSLDPSGLPTFTNDSGESGLAGLLNDFPDAGLPAKRLQYDLAGATDIGEIRILTGNDGLDGRVFSTTVISLSTDNGANFDTLGYFQSDPSGTTNSGQWGSTLVTIFDDASPFLASGVTNIQFDFYGVDNTGGQMRDPFDGENPFTGADDGLSAPNTSPLVWEIDVLTVPEPSSVMLASLATLGVGLIARRRR